MQSELLQSKTESSYQLIQFINQWMCDNSICLKFVHFEWSFMVLSIHHAELLQSKLMIPIKSVSFIDVTINNLITYASNYLQLKRSLWSYHSSGSLQSKQITRIKGY